MSSSAVVTLAYVLALASAGIIGTANQLLAALCYLILAFVMMNHYALKGEASYGRLLPALLLAPLLRLLSSILSLPEVPPIYWHLLIGAPLLVAMFFTIRLLRLSRFSLGLRRGPLWPDVVIILSGLPLSLLAYWILRPLPVVAAWNWPDVIIGAIILITFSGFLEELLFRGVIQSVATELFGWRGVALSGAVFTILYFGVPSPGYIAFMGLVGLGFGWYVNRFHSLWGVILAHSVMNIGLFIVWPMLWK